MKKNFFKFTLLFFITFAIFWAGVGVGYFYLGEKREGKNTALKISNDDYVAFLMEIYDTVENNYWEKLTQKQITQLYLKAIETIEGVPQKLSQENKLSLSLYLKEKLSFAKNKKEYTKSVAQLVLQSLQPVGRNTLYIQKKEEDTSQKSKNTFPETKQETTIVSKIISPDVFYLKIGKFSSSALKEFEKVLLPLELKPKDSLHSLILDLRGNTGGDFEVLPYFLGMFIGQDQYAFEIYQRGEKIPIKTKIGKTPLLNRFKKIVILIDKNTQSWGEVVAAVLKRYNVGVLIGETSKGWGTVERVFPLKSQIEPDTIYSIILVHGLTLRDDNQPIEGKGVEPTIEIASPDWPKELYSYLPSQELVEAVKKALKD